MRGRPDTQPPMFLMINLEERVPEDHPLRPVKRQCETILRAMSRDFNRAYSRLGRHSIPPEQLLKAMLLQSLYSIPPGRASLPWLDRSETKLMEHIDFNLLFRWFLDLGDGPVWTPETFSMNRERFAKHNLVGKFFDRVVAEALAEGLASEDHFTVDGTLIQRSSHGRLALPGSWASLKSLEPRDGDAEAPDRDDQDQGNPSVNFRGQKRSNATHVSRTDPEARLMRKGKGKEALLSHSGHVLMENRSGLILAAEVDAADGQAERRAAKRPWLGAVATAAHARAEAASRHAEDDGAGRRVRRRGVPSRVGVGPGGGTARADPARKDRRHRLRRRGAASGFAPTEPGPPTPGDPGLSAEPADPEARRGDLRLAQDGGRAGPDAIRGPMEDSPGVPPGGRGVQPAADGPPEDAAGGPGGRLSRARTVGGRLLGHVGRPDQSD